MPPTTLNSEEPLYGSPLAWLFRIYPLNFFTRFIYSLTSITV